jgi:hypothetical protein
VYYYFDFRQTSLILILSNLKENRIVAANISQICFLSGSLNKLHLGTFDLCLDAADFFDEKNAKKNLQ